MINEFEKKWLPEDLHDIYNDDEFEDFGKLEIESIEILEDRKSIKILVKFTLDSEGTTQKYIFNLFGVEYYRINPSTEPFIEISQDDHRLLIHNSTYKSLYFTQPAENSDSLISKICSLIYGKYKMKITIEDIFMNYDQFLYRSRMNYGLFVNTAQEIVQSILPLFQEQNMKPTIYTSTAQINENNLKIVYFGKSYFVFDGLEVTPSRLND